MSSSTDERSPSHGGFALITAATAIAGVGGYAVTTVIARGLGDEGYATFAIFWAALYLVIGGLSGVQQEISRATRPAASPVGAAPIVLAAALSGIVVLTIGATAPVWSESVFTVEPALAWPVAVGAGSYIFVAVFSGSMYGLSLWRPLSAIIVLDMALRLGVVTLGFAGGAATLTLAWLTVVPFPLVALVALVGTRWRVVRARLDVGYSAALANVVRTVLAATATAVLVSGFPLLIGLAGVDAGPRALSALIFALTLTRAPLVVATLALQSYLVVHFRDRPDAIRRLIVYVALLLAAAVVLALLMFLAGKPLFLALTAWDRLGLDGLALALLVLSSVPTGVLAVTGAAVLAKSRHTLYSAGWVIGAAVAIGILFVPGEITARVLIALSIGPLVGVLMYGIGLARRR